MVLYDLEWSNETYDVKVEIRLRDEGRVHTFPFCIWPRMWAGYKTLAVLNWQAICFDINNAEAVPDQPGIYAFLIRPNIEVLIGTEYLIYVGKTERTLRQRFREYIREKNNRFGRAKVVEFLQKYDAHILFTCAIVDGQVKPNLIENELLKAFMPPANSDFPAEVRRIIPYQ